MRALAGFAVSCIVVAVALFAYWHDLGRAVGLHDVPDGRVQCLSYSPYDGGGSPLDGESFHVDPARIDADLALIKSVTGCIRTYSSLGVQGDVTTIAAGHGLDVLQGIWISGDPEANEKEIARAVDLARRHPETVKGIFVGNEVMLRREMTAAALAAIVRRVKAATGVPVLYADVPHFWKLYPEVAEAVDRIAIHVLPYWDDPAPVGIDEVQDHVAAVITDMRRRFPGKDIIVGETGWPSAGRTRGAAVPGLVNQARFVREFVATAQRLGVGYNLIEAVDQPWKRAPEGTVGGYWGLFDTDRDLKFPLTGAVREWPHWPAAFAASLVLAVGFMLLAARGGVAGRHWIYVAALAVALGISLVHQWVQTAFASQSILGWLFGAYMTAMSLWAALVLSSRWLSAPPIVARRKTIGALYWLAVPVVAVLALTIGFDGRHRDLPVAGLWLVGLTLAIMARPPAWTEGRARPVAWLTVILLIGAALAFEGPANIEVALWCLTVLLFAVPGIGALAAEARLLASAVTAGGADKGDHQGDRRAAG